MATAPVNACDVADTSAAGNVAVHMTAVVCGGEVVADTSALWGGISTVVVGGGGGGVCAAAASVAVARGVVGRGAEALSSSTRAAAVGAQLVLQHRDAAVDDNYRCTLAGGWPPICRRKLRS